MRRRKKTQTIPGQRQLPFAGEILANFNDQEPAPISSATYSLWRLRDYPTTLTLTFHACVPITHE